MVREEAQSKSAGESKATLTYHHAPVELRRSVVDTREHEYFSDLGKAERG